MGVSTCIYIGPYIKVKNSLFAKEHEVVCNYIDPKTFTTPEACPAKTRKDGYCSICGKNLKPSFYRCKKIEFSLENDPLIFVQSNFDQDDEDETDEICEYIISNRTDYPGFTLDNYDRKEVLVNFTSLNIENEIKTFKEFYGETIAQIQEAYGELEFCFGFLKWFN